MLACVDYVAGWSINADRGIMCRIIPGGAVFLSSTAPFGEICSFEHENAGTSFLDVYIAQADAETSANGIELMGSTGKTLRARLEAIRDLATNALDQIERSQEERSMRWKCKDCQYIKHFTKPVSLETAGRCPRCKSTEFRPVL